MRSRIAKGVITLVVTLVSLAGHQQVRMADRRQERVHSVKKIVQHIHGYFLLMATVFFTDSFRDYHPQH